MRHKEQPSDQFQLVCDIVQGEVTILKTGIQTNYYPPHRSENGKEKAAFTFTRGTKKFKITIESEDTKPA